MPVEVLFQYGEVVECAFDQDWEHWSLVAVYAYPYLRTWA